MYVRVADLLLLIECKLWFESVKWVPENARHNYIIYCWCFRSNFFFLSVKSKIQHALLFCETEAPNNAIYNLFKWIKLLMRFVCATTIYNHANIPDHGEFIVVRSDQKRKPTILAHCLCALSWYFDKSDWMQLLESVSLNHIHKSERGREEEK